MIDWAQFPESQIESADVTTADDFGRIAAQTAKQVILQRMREAEREIMFEEYKDRVGDIVTGVVQQADSRATIVDLGRGVEALLPGSEQVPGERYEHGARIKGVIIEVRTGTRGPQIVLSRRSDELIRKLFEMEVPEIEGGHVEIRAVAREPGYRSKIAVESHIHGVDPVGACVGPRGSRVRMVVSELRGEKIDIIPWNNEPARFLAKALSPARVREVLVDDENQQATVVVPDDQLSLAIGREGQNARLAARLTGWRVEIKGESEFAEEEAEIAFSGGETDDVLGGRCAAVMASGKRCPNNAIPGSRFCDLPAHPGHGAEVAPAEPPHRGSHVLRVRPSRRPQHELVPLHADAERQRSSSGAPRGAARRSARARPASAALIARSGLLSRSLRARVTVPDGLWQAVQSAAGGAASP